MLERQIALARDELVGQGVYEGRQVEDDRRRELDYQIEAWKVLQKKLARELH